jgi:hypothetical protein
MDRRMQPQTFIVFFLSNFLPIVPTCFETEQRAACKTQISLFFFDLFVGRDSESQLGQ